MIHSLSYLLTTLMLMTSFFVSTKASAQAFGPQLTYHGRILDTNGGTNVPVTGSVNFLLQIVHPDIPTCVLYQETQTQNLTATDGNFTLTVNGSAAVTPAPMTSTFADVWITDPARTINCINGGTANGSSNSRRLNVYFVPPGGSTAYEPLPSQAINYVPLAIESLNTNSVGGFGATSLLRVVDASVLPAVPWAIPAMTKELYNELDATIKGNSAYYVTSAGTVANFSGSLQGDITGVQSATVLSRIFGRPLSTAGSTFVGGEVLFFDGTNWITKQGSAGTVQSVTSGNGYLSVAGALPSNNPNIDALLTINVGTTANTVAAGNDARIVGALQASTPLSGDVTGLVSTTVVATVGGKTAAAIATSVNDTIAATANSTLNTIVKRDGSGNIAVNSLSTQNASTRNLLLYNAANTQYATISVPAALSVSYALTLPSTLPVSGFVLATQGNGQLSWVNPIAGAVTNVSANAPLFSTGGTTPVISISQATSTTDGFLSAAQFTIFNNKVASVTVTAPLTIAGTSQTPLLGLQNSGVISGSYTKVSVDAKGIVTSGALLTATDIPNLDASKITTGTFPIQRGGTGESSFLGNSFLTVNAGGTSFTGTVCAANEVPFFNGLSWTCKTASSLNSSATLVMRDSNGDFTANNITTVQNMTVQANLRVQNGVAGSYIGLAAPIFTPNYDITLPSNFSPPNVGQVLSVLTATGSAVTTTWVNALSDSLASGSIFVGNASGVATGRALIGDATLSNNGVLTLSSVGSGITSGLQYTKVTVDGKGRVVSGAQLNNSDVTLGLGYVPMNSVSSTAPITISGGASNPVIGFANSGVVSGTYGTNTAIPFFTVDNFGRITSAGSQAYADATSSTKGIVQIGSNITVTAGTISVTSANVIAAAGTLGGDVSGTLNNTVVMTVGGKTATQISQSVSDTIAATSLNSSGTIVKRDANGNFTANNINTVQDMTVQRNLRVQDGSIGNYIGFKTPIGLGAAYDITLPDNSTAPVSGQVLSVYAATSSSVLTKWMNALTDALSPGYLFVGNTSGIATGVALTGDATLAASGVLTLSSVGSGITSGLQYTKVTVDGKGRVTSGASLISTDITNALGYTPTNLVSVSSPLAITGGASNPVISLNFSGVVSGVYPKVTVDQWGRVTSGTNLTNADVTFGLGYSPMNSVSVSTPLLISGGASNPTISLALSGVVSGVYPKVTVDQWGRVTSGTNLSAADITLGLGYTPMHFVSATAPILLTGPASSPIITLANSGVVSGSYGSSTGFPTFIVDNYGRVTSASISTYADATSSTKGIVQIGSNITVTAGTISVTSANVIAAVGTLGGDVSGTLNNTVVMTVGGKTATQISQSVSDTIAATSLNSSGTIVKRDANGNFTANNINTVQDMTVQRNLRVQDGSIGNYIGFKTPIGLGAAYDITLPDNSTAPVSGQVLSVYAATSSSVLTKWMNALTDALTPGYILVGNTSGIATGVALTGDAALSASGVLTLSSVGSGITSGLQYTKVTVDGKGRVVSGAQLNNSDVTLGLGYVPMNSVSSTSPLAITGGSSNPVISLNFSGVVSGVYPKVTVDQWGRVTSGTNLTNADVTFGLGYSPMNSVSVSTPLLISGGASNPTISLGLSGVVSGVYPKVTVDQWGRVISGTNLVYNDISSALGYDPVRIVSSTSPITLSGGASNPVIGLANSGVVAGTYGSSFTNAVVTVDNFGRLTSVTSATLRVADYNTQGVVQVGNNITVTAGTISVTSANVIAAVGTLGGDVSGTLNNTVVMTVGGKTATQISQSVSDTIAATSLNSSGTIVRRDANGNFTANNINTVQDMTVQRNLRVQDGSIGNYIGFKTPIGLSMSYDITLPDNSTPPVSGQVLGIYGSSSSLLLTRWVNAITDQLASGTILIGGTSGTAVRVVVNGDATLDSSGTLRLAQTGVTSGTYGSSSTVAVVQVDSKGRIVSASSVAMQEGSSSQKGVLQVGSNLTVNAGVISLTNPNINAALGYTPVASVTTTSPITLTGTASNPVIGLATTTVAAGTYGSSFTVPTITVDAYGRLTSVTSTTLRVADIQNPGVVSIGNNITVSTSGVISLNNGNIIGALGYTPLNKAGDTMTGTLNVSGSLVVMPDGLRTTNSQFVLNNGGVGIGTATNDANAILDLSSTSKALLVPRLTASAVNAISGTTSGYIAYNTTAGSLQYFDGIWKTVATTSGAVTSINGVINQPAHWFTTGSAGTSFNIVSNSGTGVHTFNIPMAATAGVTQGALSNTQYQALVDKVTTVSGTVGQITITGGTSNPVVGLATTTVAAGTYGSSFTNAVITVDAFGRLTSVTSQTPRIADTVNPGNVSVGSNITVSTSGVISLNNGNIIGALGYTPLNKAGDTMTGTLNAAGIVNVAGALNASGPVSVEPNSFRTTNSQFVLTNNGVAVGTSTLVANAILDISSTNRGILIPRMTTAQVNAVSGTDGLLTYNTSTNTIQVYDGSASMWKSFATTSGTVTALNGISNPMQWFTTGSAGTSFNIVSNSGTGVHTFNIPMAATAGVTQGALSNTQYQALVDKVTTVSGTVGQITITGGTSNPVVGLATTTVAAGTYGSSFTVPTITVDAYGRLTSVTSTTLRVADTQNPGVVSIGNNITVSASGQIMVTGANVTSALGYTPVDKAGDTMTGTLNVTPNGFRTTNSQFSLNSGGVGIGTLTNTPNAILDINSTTQGVMFPRLTTATINASSGPAGLIAYDSNINLFRYYNGTSWQNIATTSSSVTRINGSSQTWQSFTTGSAGTSFNVVTNTGTGDHVFNIPMAATTGVTQGALSNTQYQSFVDKVTSVTGTAGQIAITGTVSSPVVGLATTAVAAGTYGSSFTVPTITVDAFGRLTSVTSSTLRVADTQNPGVVSIGTNITVSTSGQISVTAANIAAAMTAQSAKTFYAGPEVGTGLPSFRTIASTDLPVSGVAGAWVNGGNSMGVTTSFGTNDNQAIAIKTNNVTRMSIETTGTVSFAGQAHSNLNAITNSAAAVAVDANLGNMIALSTSAAANVSQTLNISNVRIGAAYTVVVTRGTPTSISQTNINCNGVASRYVPTNGARSSTGAAGKSVYTFIYDGTECLVTWITGF